MDGENGTGIDIEGACNLGLFVKQVSGSGTFVGRAERQNFYF